jgi:hypothetical protein
VTRYADDDALRCLTLEAELQALAARLPRNAKALA